MAALRWWLLAGAGLAIHSFWNLTRVDVGLQTDHVLTFGLDQAPGRFKSPEQMYAYNQRMLSELQSAPGVSAAATVTGRNGNTSYGLPAEEVRALLQTGR